MCSRSPWLSTVVLGLGAQCYGPGQFREEAKPPTWCAHRHPRVRWDTVACMRNRHSCRLWLQGCLVLGLWAGLIVFSSTFCPGNGTIRVAWELVRHAHCLCALQIGKNTMCGLPVSQGMGACTVRRNVPSLASHESFIGKTEEHHGPRKTRRFQNCVKCLKPHGGSRETQTLKNWNNSKLSQEKGFVLAWTELWGRARPSFFFSLPGCTHRALGLCSSSVVALNLSIWGLFSQGLPGYICPYFWFTWLGGKDLKGHYQGVVARKAAQINILEHTGYWPTTENEPVPMLGMPSTRNTVRP